MSKDKHDPFKKVSPHIPPNESENDREGEEKCWQASMDKEEEEGANLRVADLRRPIFSHQLEGAKLELEWSKTSNYGDTFSSVITAVVECLNLKEQKGKVDVKSEIFDSAMKSVDEKLKDQKGKVDVESEMFDSAVKVLYEKLKDQKGKGDTNIGSGL